MNIYETVAQMQALKPSGTNIVAYCKETKRIYRYESSYVIVTADSRYFLSTGNGGDTRWICTPEHVIFAVNKNATNQTGIADNVATKITWSAKGDTHGYFDIVTNNRFQPLIPGRYFLYLLVTLNALTTAATTAIVSIYFNGAATFFKQVIPVNALEFALDVSGRISFNGSSDYAEAYITVNVNAPDTTSVISGNVAKTAFFGQLVN